MPGAGNYGSPPDGVKTVVRLRHNRHQSECSVNVHAKAGERPRTGQRVWHALEWSRRDRTNAAILKSVRTWAEVTMQIHIIATYGAAALLLTALAAIFGKEPLVGG